MAEVDQIGPQDGGTPTQRPTGLSVPVARRYGRPEVRMVPGVIRHDGRRVRFAVSDNEGAHGPEGPGSPPVWALNVHGFFAGGGMYWRESAHLAQTVGWRVVNPSLPGFGGSDCLDWNRVSMTALAEQVRAVADHVGVDAAVLLGHSMGGAVVVEYGNCYPERTLGIIYRAGIATPAWKKRNGPITASLAPFAPDLAAGADLVASVVVDFPDLLVGRFNSTLRSVYPDFRRNIRTMGRTVPVGSMLMAIDLRDELRDLTQRDGVPFLPVWGVLDRVAHARCAMECAAISGTEVQWVPGGHSWMLARPSGQGDVLRHLERGRSFVDAVGARRTRLAAGTTPVGSAHPA